MDRGKINHFICQPYYGSLIVAGSILNKINKWRCLSLSLSLPTGINKRRTANSHRRFSLACHCYNAVFDAVWATRGFRITWSFLLLYDVAWRQRTSFTSRQWVEGPSKQLPCQTTVVWLSLSVCLACKRSFPSRERISCANDAPWRIAHSVFGPLPIRDCRTGLIVYAFVSRTLNSYLVNVHNWSEHKRWTLQKPIEYLEMDPPGAPWYRDLPVSEENELSRSVE